MGRLRSKSGRRRPVGRGGRILQPGSRRWRMAKSRRSPWRTLRSACPISASRTPKAARELQDWHGRTVLVNLWATWCVPCRKEMPALDALQADLGGRGFEVVAVNIDTRDPQKPLTFLKDAGGQAPGLLFRSKRQGVSGPEKRRQGLWHADDADHRPVRLRDRRNGGTRRMGERGRHEACECSAWQCGLNVGKNWKFRLSASSHSLTTTHALTSRFVPKPVATLASGLKFCCAGIDQLRNRPSTASGFDRASNAAVTSCIWPA